MSHMSAFNLRPSTCYRQSRPRRPSSMTLCRPWRRARHPCKWALLLAATFLSVGPRRWHSHNVCRHTAACRRLQLALLDIWWLSDWASFRAITWWLSDGASFRHNSFNRQGISRRRHLRRGHARNRAHRQGIRRRRQLLQFTYNRCSNCQGSRRRRHRRQWHASLRTVGCKHQTVSVLHQQCTSCVWSNVKNTT